MFYLTIMIYGKYIIGTRRRNVFDMQSVYHNICPCLGKSHLFMDMNNKVTRGMYAFPRTYIPIYNSTFCRVYNRN